jgi:hypothetical protein
MVASSRRTSNSLLPDKHGACETAYVLGDMNP